jgi:hypothetical protein
MKLRLLLALLSLTSLKSQAQGYKNFNWLSNHSSLNISAGQYYADFSKLNIQLNLLGAKNQFNSTYYMFGITRLAGETSVGGRYGESLFDGTMSLEFMPAQKVTIGNNDSITYKMNGWHLTTSLFGKDVIPGDVVALVLAPGVDWGTMKIARKDAVGETKYKNPFVSPLIRADLRFEFGKLSIGGRAMYRYDITHELWKRKNQNMIALQGTKFSGLGLQAFIGFRIETADNSDNPLDQNSD